MDTYEPLGVQPSVVGGPQASIWEEPLLYRQPRGWSLFHTVVCLSPQTKATHSIIEGGTPHRHKQMHRYHIKNETPAGMRLPGDVDQPVQPPDWLTATPEEIVRSYTQQ